MKKIGENLKNTFEKLKKFETKIMRASDFGLLALLH